MINRNVIEDIKITLADVIFTATTAMSEYTATSDGYLFIRNQGANDVHLNVITDVGTVTTDSLKLTQNESITLPYKRIGETVKFIANGGNSVMAGYVYDYVTR